MSRLIFIKLKKKVNGCYIQRTFNHITLKINQEQKNLRHIPCHYENYLLLTYVGVKQASSPI